MSVRSFAPLSLLLLLLHAVSEDCSAPSLVPVLLGMAAGLLKVVLTVAFVFRFYFDQMNDIGHWGQLLSKCPSWHDQAGLVSSLIAAPACA